MNALFDGLRTQYRALLAGRSEPHAELLALVWGSRFDREHARELVRSSQRAGVAVLDAWVAVSAAADSFDRLSPARQQRLRQMLLREHRLEQDEAHPDAARAAGAQPRAALQAVVAAA